MAELHLELALVNASDPGRYTAAPFDNSGLSSVSLDSAEGPQIKLESPAPIAPIAHKIVALIFSGSCAW